MRHIRILAFWLLSFCVVSVSAYAQTYTITDLGLFSPSAINSAGQVVGTSNGHAFLWTQTGSRDLGVLPGGTFSGATGINDQGVITGTADGRGIARFGDESVRCRTLIQPFIWTSSQGMLGLGTLVPTGSLLYYACHIHFYATGINDSIEVVGYHPEVSSYEDGFKWTRTNDMTLLGGYQSAANGINNFGFIVENYSEDLQWLEDTSHAAVNGERFTDVGTLGGADPDWQFCSSGNGINDAGQVAGWSTINPIAFLPCDAVIAGTNAPHAFRWTENIGMQDLGTLAGDSSSMAVKINSGGQVIGTSGNTVLPQDGQQGGEAIRVVGRPFIWSQNSGMQDLNTLIPANSGWVLNSVVDINASGTIVGLGTVSGQVRGFLLTPARF